MGRMIMTAIFFARLFVVHAHLRMGADDFRAISAAGSMTHGLELQKDDRQNSKEVTALAWEESAGKAAPAAAHTCQRYSESLYSQYEDFDDECAQKKQQKQDNSSITEKSSIGPTVVIAFGDFSSRIASEASSECSLSCNFVASEDVRGASALVFSAPWGKTSILNATKPDGQVWYLSDWYEAPNKFGWNAALKHAQKFDSSISYSTPTSQSNFSIGGSVIRRGEKQHSNPEDKDSFAVTTLERKSILVSWGVSDCGSTRRNAYAMNLRKELEKSFADMTQYRLWEGYGRCQGQQISSEASLKVRQQSVFYLAFENSECKGYFSEKPNNAFEAGAIPILIGGVSQEDAEQNLPPQSYIHVDAFPDERELAKHLRNIVHDPQKFSAFHAWRDNVLYTRPQLNSALCRVCEVSHGLRAYEWKFTLESWQEGHRCK